MTLVEAREAILESIGLIVEQLDAAQLEFRYQSVSGYGYEVIDETKTLASYFSDKAWRENATPDGHPSLHVGFHYKTVPVDNIRYAPALLPSLQFPVITNKTSSDIRVDLVHNTTLYHVSETFFPWAPI